MPRRARRYESAMRAVHTLRRCQRRCRAILLPRRGMYIHTGTAVYMMQRQKMFSAMMPPLPPLRRHITLTPLRRVVLFVARHTTAAATYDIIYTMPRRYLPITTLSPALFYAAAAHAGAPLLAAPYAMSLRQTRSYERRKRWRCDARAAAQ